MTHPALRLLPICILWIAHAASAQTSIPLSPIGNVQGTGGPSPLVGQLARVRGRVIALQGGTQPGVFLQDAGDGNPETPDGIFVDLTRNPAGFSIGTPLEVIGMVTELGEGRGHLTALVGAQIEAPTASVPRSPAVRLTAPPSDWARYESMQVHITTPLRVAGTHRFAKSGELAAQFGEDRLRMPTEVFAPGPEAKALAADNNRRLLVLDDGSDAENPENIWYLAENALPRTGSVLRGVEGVVVPRKGGVRLILTAKPLLHPAPKPKSPKVDGDVRIASLNLENLFNGDGAGGGFPTPRGARTPAELEAQLGRLTATIHGLDADVVALMEVENDGYGPDSAIAQLVAALNRDGGDWRYIDAGQGPGSDQIRVGLIHRASRATPVGAPATLEDDLFGTRSRPPLAQSFRAGDGPVFTVVANHFKSKGCGEASGADADQKDGQACWNAARTESARRLDAWLRTDPTRSGSDLRLIVGDLNAYRMEDPVRLLVDAGWRDAFEVAASGRHRGEPPYSYVFDSLTGRLDHALLSPSLATRLRGAAEWHTNADEPDSRGYQEAPDQRGPWRSSDHDPLVLGFRLRKP